MLIEFFIQKKQNLLVGVFTLLTGAFCLKYIKKKL